MEEASATLLGSSAIRPGIPKYRRRISAGIPKYCWTCKRAQTNGPISHNREYRQYRVHYFGHVGGPGRRRVVTLYHKSLSPGLPKQPKTPQISSNRDHKALSRGTLGGLGCYKGHDFGYFGCPGNQPTYKHPLSNGELS